MNLLALLERRLSRPAEDPDALAHDELDEPDIDESRHPELAPEDSRGT